MEWVHEDLYHELGLIVLFEGVYGIILMQVLETAENIILYQSFVLTKIL